MRSLLLVSCFLSACHPTAPARDSSSGASHEQLPAAPSRAPAVENATDRPRVALVIGNGDYHDLTKLDAPPRDARHVAARLAQLDFDVELLIDADRAALLGAIAHLGKRLKAPAPDQPQPVGLFYFSGHGLQYQGHNYVMPLGPGISELSEIPARGVELSHVLETLRTAGNPFNMVVLDASRDNAYTDDSRGTRGLARIDAPERTLLAYAAAPGHFARDPKAHETSVFTRTVLRHVARPGIPVAEAFAAVAADVQRETDGKQVPWSSSNFMGEFAFSPCPEAVESNGVSCGAREVECDRGTWNGERCVPQTFDCPRGFEMIENEGCRRE